MHGDLLSTLALVLFLGVGAQWLASSLRVPSILLLLLAGFLAGPLLGLLAPDRVFGELLFPVTSLSVALILFEGGLTLDFSELRGAGRAIRNLVTIGALVTWVLVALAAHWTLDLPAGPSALLGAILVVTGPTVVGPLLRHVNATGRVAAIAKWEGILIDPIGATLAVLVFETLLAQGIGQATALALWGLVATLLVGTLTGLLGAGLVVLALRRARAPEHLHNALVLMLVAAVHALSNHLQEESGLLAVTLMGVALANQHRVDVRHVREFKRNLQVLLLAGLFVVLAARMDFAQLQALGWSSLVFLALVILVVRPLAVLASTWRTDLSWAERLFLADLAPRGIVAAAVSALFSIRLAEAGLERASLIASATFLVIVGTVVVYGLTAGPLARRLGLALRDPQGVLILGAHEWARQLAAVLGEEGVPVALCDTNWASVSRARVSGLEAHYGNVLGDDALDRLGLGGTRHFLALTSNPEVNALACVRLTERLGRANVYRLPAPPELVAERSSVARDFGGQVLFGHDATWERIAERLRSGAVIKRTRLSEDFDLHHFRELYGPDAWILFVHEAGGALVPVTPEERAAPRPGDSLIALVHPPEEEREEQRREQRDDEREQERADELASGARA